MISFDWSGWRSLDLVARDHVPDSPGLYEIRTDYEFGRLIGVSSLVYIGSASVGEKPSLRVRLIDQRIKDPKRYMSRAEKYLVQAGHKFDFRFASARDGKEAESMEARRLIEYENRHWELPPGNSKMPNKRTAVPRHPNSEGGI